MNKDIFVWKMKQLAWDIKAEWSDLTDGEINGISNKEQLEGLIQEKYGLAKEEVSNKVAEFEKKYL